jgi:hypothetical protein
MSTLPIRAPHTAHIWQVPSFARAIAAVLTSTMRMSRSTFPIPSASSARL